MISPARLDKLPADMVNLVQDLQEDIIRDVCRRFSKANYLTPTAEWQLYKANQLQLSYNEVNRRIARFLKVRERDVQSLYTDTVKQALKEDGDIYRIAAAQGKLLSSTGARIDSYFRSAAFSRLLSKGLKNCKNGVRNLCNSMAAQTNRDLSYAMDYAHIQVLSGAFSYNDAIYHAVKRLTESGLTRVEYPSGRRDNVDVCVRRAVLSSVNKSCCDLQLDLAREVGSKYVEVSAHMGARPSHAEWQGQIYCLEKGDSKYPYFYEATGYGTGEGLGGWNCRHNFFPYFEGIDTPYHSPNFSKEENNEYYALTQKQRAYERAVRKSKRELAALDGARSGTDDPQLKARLDVDFARKSVTLKAREKRLDEFVRANGLVKENERVRVVGFGKSVSQKAVHANQSIIKYLDKDDMDNIKEIMRGYKKYSEKYPDCGFNYFMVDYKLKQMGIKNGTALRPVFKRAYILPDETTKRDPYHIMHRMKERNITDDNLEEYMRNAKVMFVQWNGQRQVFYSSKGVTVITKSNNGWIYKTAWTEKDFDEPTQKIMEVINKYVGT